MSNFYLDLMGSLPTRFMLAAGLLAGSLVPAEAAAQRVASSLDAQSTRLRYSDTLYATAVGLTPSLDIGWDNASLNASGTYAQLAHAWSADGFLGASVFSPLIRAFSAELTGEAGGSAHQDGAHTGSAVGIARLHMDGGNAGAWLGAGGGATSDGAAWRSVRQAEAGAWVERGPATLTLSAQPTAVDDSIRYTDLAAKGSWRGNIFEFGAVAVTRAGSNLPLLGTDATAWGSVSVVAWLLPRVALLASAGTYPVDYTQGFPGGRFASAGIRLSLTKRDRPIPSSTSAPAVRPEPVALGVTEVQLTGKDGGQQTLRLRAPGVRTVQVRGDFTAWQPRMMTRGADGWYALGEPLVPGTYQMNVRVNGGAWLPPPSLTTVRDEFGGVAAVLVVP
jgi:hypothetical protein